MAQRSKRSTKKPEERPRRRWWAWLTGAAVVLGSASLPVAYSLLLPFWDLAGHFAELSARQPSLLYGAPTVLAVGDRTGPEAVIAELWREGYRDAGAGPVTPGLYRSAESSLQVHLRRFLTAEGRDGGKEVAVAYDGDRVRAITVGGRQVRAVRLPPPLIAVYRGERLEESWPVELEEVPVEVVDAVLAAEDATFFDHRGLSISGIVRAAWVNLAGGEIRQGGSTLTQQLVKNLFLSHERTLERKSREAVLAVMLELRFDKRQILEAYLNEIYLGASEGVSLIGIGSAARTFFGKEPRELDLAEAAVLAGMIRSPATTSPALQPDAARQRRDQVLQRMVEVGWLAEERARQILGSPVVLRRRPVLRRGAPYFRQAMAEEAARRYGVEDLEGGGYVLFSTLREADQRNAEQAIRRGLAELEDDRDEDGDPPPLQAALVSLDPANGDILAYVGGRDYELSQFDRAGRARRQAGSAFKPVVFAAAFENEGMAPSSWIYDSPLTVRLAGRRWSPRNHGGDYHGWVTARTAVEQSLNTATARVALQAGLPAVVELARAMGVSGRLQPFPALALGAFEVTPLEMASVYATLANQGLRPPVHGLRAVLDPRGHWMRGASLPPPRRSMSPQTSYLITSILQGVLDRGTGRGARGLGLTDRLAGKSGTTNGQRDAWFAGYSPDRATVVWVGHDDNSKTRLTGARGALPLWTRFLLAVRPSDGWSGFPAPPGVISAAIDPDTGELASEACPRVQTEVFLDGQVPWRVCRLHRSSYDFWRQQRRQRDLRELERRRLGGRRWRDRVFGHDGG